MTLDAPIEKRENLCRFSIDLLAGHRSLQAILSITGCLDYIEKMMCSIVLLRPNACKASRSCCNEVLLDMIVVLHVDLCRNKRESIVCGKNKMALTSTDQVAFEIFALIIHIIVSPVADSRTCEMC